MDTELFWERMRSLGADLLSSLPNLILALAALVLFYAAGTGFRAAVRRVMTDRRKHRNVGLVLGRVVQWLGIMVGALVALGIMFPSVDARTLLELLGIGSLAVGLGFREILQNFLAGILLLLAEPFRVGDQIALGDLEGTVETIQTRATTIVTYDGRRVVIPNAELVNNSVVVNTAFAQRRIEYDVGIGYADDVERAKELILAVLHDMPGVLRDPPPSVLLVDLAPSTVNLRARWWIMPPRRADALDTRDAVLTAIKSTLTENGIDLPFPTQQILFHDHSAQPDAGGTGRRELGPGGTQRSLARPVQDIDTLRPPSPGHHVE